MQRQFVSRQVFTIFWARIVWLTSTLLFHTNYVRADNFTIDTIPLPPLRIDGQAAKAHTQGLEVAGASYYVTARREDVRPKRALLLRSSKSATHWDVWDITPHDSGGAALALDHPGGMQSDGRSLWIPTSASKPKSRSVIRAFPLTSMIVGQPLEPEFEFPVNDHIGAIAVSTNHNLVLGANWDTESVYIWDLQGNLKRTLTGSELGLRGLGAVAGADTRSGIAVQDWKIIGDRLFASGLAREAGAAANAPKSRFVAFTNFLESDFQRSVVTLPLYQGTELAREAIAISDGDVLFLPEDLGVSNRIFQLALTNLFKLSHP